MRTKTVTLIFIYSLTSYCGLNFVNSIQPTPFIDEIFHIPQAIKYCQRSYYEWDPKITTLPGLYILPAALHEATGLACSVYNLRGFSTLVSVVMLLLFLKILQVLDGSGEHPGRKSYTLWSALNISIFPPLYLYSFLFYTEILSTCCFLLVFYLHLKDKFILASIAGLVCFAVRQTNILWIGFLILHYLSTRVLTPFEDWRWLLDMKRNKSRLVNVVVDLAGYFCLCVLVLMFFIWNRGIVVGDRSAHDPVFHAAQLCHFGLFSAVFLFPFNVRNLTSFFKFMGKVKFIAVILVSAFTVTYFSHAHIYLLSDNRHYSFYYWKMYSRNAFMKYLLLPVSIFGLYSIHENLIRFPWRYAFWFCTCVNLMPQHLLEFRYFILPFLVNRMHLKVDRPESLALETCLNIVVNIFVLTVFKMKTFYWSDSSDVQRIICWDKPAVLSATKARA